MTTHLLKSIGLFSWMTTASVLLSFCNIYAQSIITFPVVVREGLANGQITMTHSPILNDGGVIGNAFNGALNDWASTDNVNPMVVTLQFNYEFTITETSVYAHYVESGVWTVESANTLADINSQTGSYKKLVNLAAYTPYTVVSRPVNAKGRVLRLTMQKQTGDNNVHLSEWGITATGSIAANLCMKPNTVRLIPNATFQPNWFGTDANGNSVPVTSGMTWTSSNPSVVSVNSSGVFAASGNLGEATITASWNSQTYQTKVKVVNDFVSPSVEKRVVKVAMVIIDPQIPAAGGQRFSERFWAFNGGPMKLAQQTRDSMFSISGGTVDYQFTEIHQEPTLMTKFGGTLLSVDSMYKLFLEPGWTTLRRVSEQLNQSEFLYNDLLNKYDLCNKSNSHQVDEVWVWAMPFIGMYESNMTGTGAFWINGPAITGNTCTDLLPIMGFNYERYAGCSLHNFTHRIEQTMFKVYDYPQIRYSPTDPPYPVGAKNALQTFMMYDALEPGNAHLGNSHFPPNGIENYDYDNTNPVLTHAPNWKRYPFLFDETKTINCTEWGCEGDCGLNFMSYWMRHIPHFKCKDKTGRLNNWWSYVIDYNEGKTLEAQTDNCNCKMFDDDVVASCDHKSLAPWELWISNVKLNNINNASDKYKDFNTLGYSDFTNVSTSIQKGQSYPLSITPGLSWSGNLPNVYCRAWIDYNGNNTFETNEMVFQNTNMSPLSGNIVVPLTAVIGNVKMRIALKWGAYPDPCETFDKGEVEDYTINITEGQTGGVYCASKGTVPWELWISKLQFNTINNASDKYKDFATLGYSDYTNLTTTIQKGQSYPLSITPGLSWSGNLPNVYCRVWIDYNGNKTFESAEMVLQSTNVNPFTSNVIMPTSAITGNTRMRVAMKWGGYPEPCEVFAKGEVEDYTINITEGGTGGMPDLTLSNLTISTPSVQQGQVLNFKVDLKNIGTGNASRNFNVKAYISTDNVLSANDVQDGVIPTGNFVAGFTAAQVSGASTIPATLAAGQYYLILKIDADNQITESNENNNVLVSATTFTVTTGQTNGTYCASKGTTPWEQWISSVTVFTNIVVTTFPSTVKEGYGNFTTATAAVAQRGEGGLISIYPQSSWRADPRNANMFWRVWMDFNHDNDFNDPGEMVVSRAVGITSSGVFFDNDSGFSVPTTALVGRTRMRVSMKVGGYPTPCETFERGEVEDYAINIIDGLSANQSLIAFGNLKAQIIEAQIRLDWVKYSDKITAFTIEKSLDGQIFSFMKKIPVTPFDAYYYVYDTQPTEGVNFYRVKMVLNTGDMVYSNIQKVNYEQLVDFSVFPNPTNEEVYVDLKAFENKTVNISISNLIGKVVLNQTIESVNTAPQRLDISKLESGAYFIRVETKGSRGVVRKLEIMK